MSISRWIVHFPVWMLGLLAAGGVALSPAGASADTLAVADDSAIHFYDTVSGTKLPGQINYLDDNPGATPAGMDFNLNNGDLYVTYTGKRDDGMGGQTRLDHYVARYAFDSGTSQWSLADSFTPPTNDSGITPDTYDVEVIDTDAVYISHLWRFSYQRRLSVYDGTNVTSLFTTSDTTGGIAALATDGDGHIWAAPQSTRGGNGYIWEYDPDANTSTKHTNINVGYTGMDFSDGVLTVVQSSNHDTFPRDLSLTDGSILASWTSIKGGGDDNYHGNGGSGAASNSLADIEYDSTGLAYIALPSGYDVIILANRAGLPANDPDGDIATYTTFASGLNNPRALAMYVVPEPGAAMLALTGGAILLVRRRRA